MITMLFIFEDNTIRADRGAEGWEVTIGDVPTGDKIELRMTDVQFGAVMALAAGVAEETENRDEELADKLYAIAAPVFEGVNQNLRIIP